MYKFKGIDSAFYFYVLNFIYQIHVFKKSKYRAFLYQSEEISHVYWLLQPKFAIEFVILHIFQLQHQLPGDVLKFAFLSKDSYCCDIM